MKSIIKDYINNEIKLERYQWIGIFLLIFVLTGVFGWIYEYIFYYFNFGMKEFYWQGGNFLPWINIYAIGSFLILFFTHKVKNKPVFVFLISFIVTGILEYASGYVIYEFFGQRFWDYNVEIWNFLNIDGFVCLRSVTFFGISSLILIYLLVPFCILLSKKIPKKIFLTISILLFSIVMFDELYNLIIARMIGLPRACDIYKKIGIKYMSLH